MSIVRAVVEIKKIVLRQNDIKTPLKAIQQRIGDHNTPLSAIYDAMENLLDDKRHYLNGKKEKE
jgi:hypothetical protein